MSFARCPTLRSKSFRTAGLCAIVANLLLGGSSPASDDVAKAESPKADTNRPEPRGRRVTLRYDKDDPAAIPGLDSAEGVYDFAVRLTSDMRRFGVSRVILPDPARTDRPDDWLAVARHAATMGFEVRFEIDPAGSDPGHADGSTTAARTNSAPAEPSNHLPVTLDAALADRTKTRILERVDTLTSLKNASEAQVTAGYFVALAPPAALPAGWEGGLNESTFVDFLRDTGLEADWGERLKDEAARRDFVKSRGLMPWLSWRSRRIASFYGGLADEIHRKHALTLTIAAPHPGDIEAHSLYEEAERIGSSPLFAWRWMAFEPELWNPTASLRLIGAKSVSDVRSNRDWATHPDLETALGPQATQGHWFASGRSALPPRPETSTGAREGFEKLMAAMISYLSRHDSAGLIVDRDTLGETHAEFAAWVTRYEGLPEVGRKAWETVAPKPGLTLRCYAAGGSELLVPINPLPCPVGLELVLTQREGPQAEPLDPDSDLKLVVESTGRDRAVARLSIPPMHLGRVDLGNYRVETYRVELPQESQDVIRTRYDALIRQNGDPAAQRPGAPPGTMTEAETKTRGRRLMAALQAYRDRRLADFFRLSDGIASDRSGQAFTEIPPNVGRVDLPKRRLIR